MNEQLIRNIEWYGYNQTVLHPIALILALVCGLVLIFVHKKYAVLFFLIPTIYITEMQRIVIGGLDFNMIKIMVIFGFIRIIARREIFELKLNKIDIAFVAWNVTLIIIYTIQQLSFGAFVYKVGYSFNALGLYFIFRTIITDIDDIKNAIKYVTIVVIPLAMFILIEKMTGRNMFYIFGGVQEFTTVRFGSLRCQGPFTHPILAGTFGAVLFPLFFVMFKQKEYPKILPILGIIASVVITISSTSSGPYFTLMTGIFGLSVWKMKRYLRIMLISAVICIGLLDLVMEAPVWYFLERIPIVRGSTSYHRAVLIDRAVLNFDEWWLVGVGSTAHWGWGLQDVTNQFIRYGIDGGLLTLLLFVFFLILCFKCLGKIMNFVNSFSPELEFLMWGFGVSLFAHIASFFGVSYFDQIIVIWFLLLAFIASSENLFSTVIEKIR